MPTAKPAPTSGNKLVADFTDNKTVSVYTTKLPNSIFCSRANKNTLSVLTCRYQVASYLWFYVTNLNAGLRHLGCICSNFQQF